MKTVAKLYDNLFTLSHKSKENQAYPIHKNLYYENEEIETLYSFLISDFEIPQSGHLLDCGCGVGFGSLLFAEKYPQLEVHGISLSAKEIDFANNLSQRRKLNNRCKFEVRSFDELEVNKYDCIIAIESLKHSPSIGRTMETLSQALRPGGKLFIIEDVGKNIINNFASQRQIRDWKLPKIFTVNDYQNTKGLSDYKIMNMNKYMKTPNIIFIILRILFAELLVLIDLLGIKKNDGATIIRGGFYQELLYAMGKLNYLILTATKVP